MDIQRVRLSVLLRRRSGRSACRFLIYATGSRNPGPLFDRYGVKYLLPCGASGLVVSLVCTSFCESVLCHGPQPARKLTLVCRVLPILACLWRSRRRVIVHLVDLERGDREPLVHEEPRPRHGSGNDSRRCWWSVLPNHVLARLFEDRICLDLEVFCPP